MATDPVVRYAAGLVVIMAFAAALAVVVHGYWINPEYTVPAAIQYLVAGTVQAALVLLGVHVGSQTTVTGADKSTEITQAAKTNGDGGHKGA